MLCVARPKIDIATKGLEDSVHGHLEEVLEERGPLSESELWEVVLEFLGPRMKGMEDKLRKSYRMRFGRKIGKKTAGKNIKQHLRLLLSKVKKGLLHTERPIIAGGNHYGRLFYARGQEGKLQAKARALVEEGGGNQLEVLQGVSKGPVKENPTNERAIDLLDYYGLVERREIGGEVHAVEPGYNPVEADMQERHAERFPDHFRVWEPFKLETWVLRDGPTRVSLEFDLAAWDPVNRIFHLALDRDYVGLNHIRRFKERHHLLGLPAKLLVFCGDISTSAERYAKRWGIEVRET